MGSFTSKRSGGLLSAGELHAAVTEGTVRTVSLALPDLHGRLVGKRHSAGEFVEHIITDGADACAYVLATDTQMRPLPGYALASWSTGYSDMRLVPDLTTLRRLPWDDGGVLVLADPHTPAGGRLPLAPRQVLREQMAELEELGLYAQAAVEAEFTVYRGTGEQTLADLRPLTPRNLDYALIHPPGLREYLREIEDVLTEACLPPSAVKTEAAPGQVEVTFRHTDPLSAADNHVLFKHTVKTITPWTENSASFMAAPVTGVGNGGHIHLSLWDDNRSNPVFPAEGGALSPAGAHAVGGLIHALPQMMPLLLPTPNSYKRLRTHSFAPTCMSWGWDNRTTAVRVTGHGSGLHLEIRIPGADANPYLALAAVLAACRHGITREISPPPAITGSAYDDPTAPLLPATLDKARYNFVNSPLAEELLGRQVVAHYATAAQVEIDAGREQVTDVERQRGFADA